MINKSRIYYTIGLIIIDTIIIVLSYHLALYITFGKSLENDFTYKNYILVLVLLIPIFLFSYSKFGFYSPQKISSLFDVIRNSVLSNIVVLLILSLFLYLFRKHENVMHYSVRVVAYFFSFVCILLCLERLAIKAINSEMRKKGFQQKHILLIGFSDASQRLIDAIKRNPEWGYIIDGILDDIVDDNTDYRKIKVIGKIQDLAGFLDKNDVDEVGITLPLSAYGKLSEIVNVCEKSGVHTKFIPDYSGIISSNPVTDDMDGVTIVNIRNVPLMDPLNRFIKRLMDIICAIVFIVISSPVMLVIALLIKITSKGPILYKQKRVGFHNKEFNMLKFRSMIQQNEEDEKKEWTTKGDPRVTKVGSFIRKTSIDELPQFFNVLSGSMSIVGPRPERKQFVEKFMEEIPRYNIKHQVRPGITGWAQVNGLRGDTSISERIKYDIYYIENWSVSFDIKVMFLTIFKGFVNKNAY